MDDLVEQFQRLPMPSRSSQLPKRFSTLSSDEIETLHEQVVAIDDDAKKSIQYRKLREILIIHNVPAPYSRPIYEASAKHSLKNGEWAEFLAVANYLISDLYPQTPPESRQSWVYSTITVLYGVSAETWGDFQTLFYRHFSPSSTGPLDLSQHLLDLIDVVIAVRSGNLVRLKSYLGNLEFIRLLPLLVSKTEHNLEQRIQKSYLHRPQDLLDRIVIQIKDP